MSYSVFSQRKGAHLGDMFDLTAPGSSELFDIGLGGQYVIHPRRHLLSRFLELKKVAYERRHDFAASAPYHARVVGSLARQPGTVVAMAKVSFM